MKILCATDFSQAADAVVSVAARWASRAQGDLVLVHAVNLDDERYGVSREKALEAATSLLRQRASRAAAAGARVETEVVIGRPDEVVLEVASRKGSDLILLSALGSRH